MTTPCSDREILMLLSDKVDRIAKVIEGNSKPGLVDRVNSLERDTASQTRSIEALRVTVQQHIEDSEKEREKRNSWWERVGLEVIKMTLSVLSALVIASLSGILK